MRGFSVVAARKKSGSPEQLKELIDELDTAAGSFGLSGGTDVSGAAVLHHANKETAEAGIGEASDLPTAEQVAREARRFFGDALPEGALSEEEYKVYERLYGKPVRVTAEEEEESEYGSSMGLGELDEEMNVGTGVLREGKDGLLEEIEFEPESEDYTEEELVELNKMLEDAQRDMAPQDADDLLLKSQIDAATAGHSVENTQAQHPTAETEDFEPTDFQRTHPLTTANQFGTSPSTIQLPKSTFVGPISILLSGMPNKHLTSAANRIFGGHGFPYSPSTPGYAKSLPQKPIPLDASQGRMSEIEADVYTAACMPAIYAAVTSVVVETRKRLGSGWLETLLAKEGGPRILDAGGAGAGVLAVREVLRAEWERMHEDADTDMAVAEAGGKTGGAHIAPPTGKATVLTASDALRQRASVLLDNTTFLPRLPDYVHASDESARERGKYDIIIAPHTLWPLKEDYLRKQHVANLWSLLNVDGGVLVLLEKGVPRGFEMVAAARDMLLETRIASPGNENVAEELSAPGSGNKDGLRRKDKGMIIAPCTNHTACPMYAKGDTKGRKDLCHFEQRYIRPPFLQKMLGAKDKNHEDVAFSYVSVMRGRDLRDQHEEAIQQGDLATGRAFAGYEDPDAAPVVGAFAHEFDPTAPAVPDVEEVYGRGNAGTPHSLSLPRAILPPLKRTGHVILDLCTPSGTLERWTVPRSFSKQAFRDARKSSWGDLWALGAKTRTNRNVRLGGKKEELGGVDKQGVVNVKGRVKNGGEEKPRRNKGKNVIEVGYDSQGNIKEEDVKVRTGGRMRQGKVKGIRDKRDKKGFRKPQLMDD